jgi:hypothetical protein
VYQSLVALAGCVLDERGPVGQNGACCSYRSVLGARFEDIIVGHTHRRLRFSQDRDSEPN